MFKVNLVTPERKLLLGEEAAEVTVPALRGELNILAGHSPLMTTLEAGVLKVKLNNGDSKQYVISWGYCQVSPEGVNILAEFANSPDELDVDSVKKNIKELEHKLLEELLEDEEYKETLSQQARAHANLDLLTNKH